MNGLTPRLLFFNLLLAVFPIGALLFLGTYEDQLLDSQERAMVQQGRLLASSLSGSRPLADTAASIFVHLKSRTDSRLQVVDRRGRLLADSAHSELLEEQAEPETAESKEQSPEDRFVYRIGAFPSRAVRFITGFFGPPKAPESGAEYYSGREFFDGPEIKSALNGRYGAATRISHGQKSVTLYSAIPIFRGNTVVGAVLVSRSTYAILSNLYKLRADIMVIFLISVAAAVVLSLLVARTVTVPVRRLRNQAEELLDERGKFQNRFKPFRGKDEVSDLSLALYNLSGRLRERTEHLEDFAADLVHEMKNPVAGILSAVELSRAAPVGEHLRFLDVIDRESNRIRRLLDDLRELISVDVNLSGGSGDSVNVQDVLGNVVSGYLHQESRGVTLQFHNRCSVPVYTDMDPDRLVQAVLNLIDNAVSFSPPGGAVDISLEDGLTGKQAAIRIKDQGPGINPAYAEKIFERWYTDRPSEKDPNHTGLGLAIVRGIAEGYGGRIFVEQTREKGGEFVLIIPRTKEKT